MRHIDNEMNYVLLRMPWAEFSKNELGGARRCLKKRQVKSKD